jgi:hypothetical protein
LDEALVLQTPRKDLQHVLATVAAMNARELLQERLGLTRQLDESGIVRQQLKQLVDPTADIFTVRV